MDHNPRRASHSGPLVPGVGWTKTGNSGKKYDDISIRSTRADLSTLSGLVASRTLLSEEYRDKRGPSQPEPTKQVAGSSESSELSGPMRKNGQNTPSITGSRQAEKGRSSTKEPVLHGRGGGFKGNKIHFSGPLLVPSNNVDQMLKEHDRQIQEAARRARLDRARLQAQGLHGTTANPIYVSSRGGG